MSPSRTAETGRRCRSTLAWCLACFAAGQLALTLLLHWQPALRDPSFGSKLTLLRRQLAEYPNRPLVLFLGSSRTVFGIRPERVTAHLDGGQRPVVFNYGEIGSGPIGCLCYLNRLLDEGIRPAHLFVEVWPCFLSEYYCYHDRQRLEGRPPRSCDLPLLRRYLDPSADLSGRWLAAQLAPCHAYRSSLLQGWAGAWLPPSSLAVSVAIDSLGWHAQPVFPEGPEKQRLLEERDRHYFEDLFRFWKVSALEDRALRQIVSLCRKHGVEVTLVFLPESRSLRNWYPPAVREEAEHYLTRLSRECAVSWIDARDWMPDSAFVESFHLDREGATAFSERFGRDILEPLLHGRTLASNGQGSSWSRKRGWRPGLHPLIVTRGSR